ncbi:hypothetical protein AB0C27_53670 [Nonomuraea sp. NPDC048882]|uniref:hypothetical protein n=1 Tax=Nonomuraea sp. NPDC048882 TaxID=3154347 RepID=UPI0033CD1804
MPNKTLSVREDDLPLWERAERAAREARTTVSALVASALASYLQDTDIIAVLVYEAFRRPMQVRFEGRWLIDSSSDLDQDTESIWRVGVAETKRGRIAIYLHHRDYDPGVSATLLDFDSIEDARRALQDDVRLPDDFPWERITAGHADRLAVEWRDI